jgi:hypothetical protein
MNMEANFFKGRQLKVWGDLVAYLFCTEETQTTLAEHSVENGQWGELGSSWPKAPTV